MTASFFSQLTFDNSFVQQLPADEEALNYPRQVFSAAYSLVNSEINDDKRHFTPTLVAFSDEVADLLDLKALTDDTDSAETSAEITRVLTGNSSLEGMQPYAMCYGGHQFGNWAGQLGDGRAINLGEVLTKHHGRQILQLKGAGPTPYSRTADGLAVLRSSIREFLCSEAMYHLGIPTTRALSLCLSGKEVMRDMLYNGDARYEKGAVVCRVSSSFMRFGNFQLPSHRNDLELLTQLVQYSIKMDFPELLAKTSGDDITVDDANTEVIFDKVIYLKWFKEISARTASMIVHWMRVGFVHGVMNTDNMSIIGETIDYGPYGWIDNFDLNWTPNTTDAQGKRYRFGAQAEIGQWNLFQLANALYPLIEESKPLENILNEYATDYQNQWLVMMANKLGINLEAATASDENLFVTLESLLSVVDTDMTLFYRALAKLPIDLSLLENNEWLKFLAPCYYLADSTKTQADNSVSMLLGDDYLKDMTAWLTHYIKRVLNDENTAEQRISLMNQTNPKFVLRNYIAQQAIEKAEQGDYSEIAILQTLLKKPYNEQSSLEQYAQKRPTWADNKAGCSMLSCSS